jgi:hypothetical protein
MPINQFTNLMAPVNLGVATGPRLFARINNLLNRTPLLAAAVTAFGASNAYGGNSPVLYYRSGLTWRAGFRTNS